MNIRHTKTDQAPHDCTECGEPAYIPFIGPSRCTNMHCPCFDEDIWEAHVMVLADPGDPPLDEALEKYLEEADTQPQISITGTGTGGLWSSNQDGKLVYTDSDGKAHDLGSLFDKG